MLYRVWSLSLLLTKLCIVVLITIHQYSKNLRNNGIQVAGGALQTGLQYAMTAFHSGGRAGIEMQVLVGVAFTDLVAILVQPSLGQVINVSRIIGLEGIRKSAKGLHHFLLGESVNNSMPGDQKFKPVVFLGEGGLAILQSAISKANSSHVDISPSEHS